MRYQSQKFSKAQSVTLNDEKMFFPDDHYNRAVERIVFKPAQAKPLSSDLARLGAGLSNNIGQEAVFFDNASENQISVMDYFYNLKDAKPLSGHPRSRDQMDFVQWASARRVASRRPGSETRFPPNRPGQGQLSLYNSDGTARDSIR